MHINHFAVISAALATFVIGGLWYSPFLFYKAWMNASGLREQDLRNAGTAKSGLPMKARRMGYIASARFWRSSLASRRRIMLRFKAER